MNKTTQVDPNRADAGLLARLSGRLRPSGSKADKPSNAAFLPGDKVDFITDTSATGKVLHGTIWSQMGGISYPTYWIEDEAGKAHYVVEPKIRLSQRLNQTGADDE